MVLASFLFACMGVCVKLAAQRYSAAELVFYRSVIALVLMSLWVRVAGASVRTRHLAQQIKRGASGLVALMLYFYAITQLPLATAVTLNYTSPLFLALLLVWWGGFRYSRPMLMALGTGFAGVVLLLQPTLNQEQWLGGLLGLASGALAGVAYFHVRALGAVGEPEVRTVWYFSLVSTVGAAIWVVPSGFSPLDPIGALLLVGVGVFASAAQLAMTRSYKRGDPIVSASLAYTTVVFASMFGAMLWAEYLNGLTWLGAGLVVLSGIAASVLSRRAQRMSQGAPVG